MNSSSLASPIKKALKKSARRCLFGKPTEDQKNKIDEWLSGKLSTIRTQKEEKWGYDFVNDAPLPGSSGYEFMPIAASTVPSFYRNKSVSSSSMSSSSSSDQENMAPSSSDCSPVQSDYSDHDMSMDLDVTMSPVSPGKRNCATPKKRQHKMTDYLKSHKKRLQRSPKTLDIVLPSSRPAHV